MEFTGYIISIVNITYLVLGVAMGLLSLRFLVNIVSGRSVILKTLEVRLPRSVYPIFKILISLGLLIALLINTSIAYLGLTGYFGYQAYTRSTLILEAAISTLAIPINSAIIFITIRSLVREIPFKVRRIRDCMAWWSSQDPKERALLNLLLITYYDTLVILALAFVGLPMLIGILVFDVYSIISQFAPIPVRYLGVLVMFLIVISVSTGYFKRVLLQCDRLDCFLVGKPLYYIMILNDVLTGLASTLIVAIASYLILSFVFGFEVYASLLLSLMLAIPVFALVIVVYFRKPWYMMPLLLPLFAIVYFRTGVNNLFQWYLRKREELVARGVCKLNDGA